MSPLSFHSRVHFKFRRVPVRRPGAQRRFRGRGPTNGVARPRGARYTRTSVVDVRSAPDVFSARRRRLAALYPGRMLFVSGFARPRNFPANRYPFRAESHFLYLVGAQLEGAALLLEGDGATLYADPPHPDDALWSGPAPSLEQLSSELGVAVRPLDELSVEPQTATLPAQDADTALWQGGLVGCDVEAGGGDELSDRDATLADALIELRLRHDDAAIEQLRLAAEVTAAAHGAGLRATRPGVTEARVRAHMEAAILERDLTLAYPSIVTVHGEVLHNERYDNTLAPGDLLLADVGAETKEGWAGDVTRTWPVSPPFTTPQREAYEVVLSAQDAAIRAVRPGVRFLDVHRAAGRAMTEGLVRLGVLRGRSRRSLRARRGGDLLPHGVGHLLGLDVHDMEDLGDRAGYAPGRRRGEFFGDRYLRLDRDLAPRMAVTIEPGFYWIPPARAIRERLGDLAEAIDWPALGAFPGVRGIRIEDDVLVTDSGCEVLTRAIPKAVEDIEARVGA